VELMAVANYWGPALLAVFGFVIAAVYQTHHFDKRFDDLKSYIDAQVKRLEDRIGRIEGRIERLEERFERPIYRP
jgi:hypothetical protein